MIFNYWKNVMGFAFAPLYVKGSFIKSAASIALPVLGGAIAGPLGISVAAGAAAGGALGGMVSGGGLKGALMGGVTGFLGGKLATSAGLFGGGMAGISSAPSSLVMGTHGVGITGRTLATGGMLQSAGSLAAMKANVGNVAGHHSMLASRAASMGSRTIPAGLTPTGAGGGFFDKLSTKVKNLFQPKGSGTVSQNIGGSQSKFLGFDRDAIENIAAAGFSAYEGDIRQSQLDALSENLGQYQDRFAGHYASEAKKRISALAEGELPETYKSALEREKDRLTRLMIAQGHNPAEAGRGAEEVVRGTMDLEHKFIGQEMDYWRAIQGGADTMTARIAALQQQQALQQRPGETGLGELGTAVVGGILGNKPKTPSVNISLDSLKV